MGSTNGEIVAGAFATWAAGGKDFFQLLDEKAVWKTQGSGPSGITTHSRQEYIERMVKPMAARFSSPLQPSVHGIWAQGDMVIVRWDGDAVANDGQPYHNEYAWFFRMQDGKVIEVMAFFDLPKYDEVIMRVPPREEHNG